MRTPSKATQYRARLRIEAAAMAYYRGMTKCLRENYADVGFYMASDSSPIEGIEVLMSVLGFLFLCSASESVLPAKSAFGGKRSLRPSP